MPGVRLRKTPWPDITYHPVGSFTKDTSVEDPASGYMSDYDLLIVVNDKLAQGQYFFSDIKKEGKRKSILSHILRRY